MGKNFMETEEAGKFSLGMIKIDGLEPTEDYRKYIELEKQGKATAADIKRYLEKEYKMRGY